MTSDVDPTAIHDATLELAEVIKSALEMAQSLMAQSASADDDVAVPVAAVARLLRQCDGLMTAAESTLEGQREEHELASGSQQDAALIVSRAIENRKQRG